MFRATAISILAILASACTTTFKLKEPIQTVDICPMTGFEARPEITALYWVMLTDIARESQYVGDLTCEKGTRPLMELRISGTHIADTQERWSALGTTMLGVVTPIAMIMAGFPIIVFWWDVPENNMVYAVDLENSYETENVVIRRSVNTSSFSGPPEDHFLKQRNAFRTDLEKLLEKNFGPK